MKRFPPDAISALAASGLTRAEVAAALGCAYRTVVAAALDHGIEFKRARQLPAGPDERSKTMAALYRAGQTLEQIGKQYGVTRERVRQIISKRHGMTAVDGGIRRSARLKREAHSERRETHCLKTHECTWAEYNELLAMGREMISKGVHRDRTPVGAFNRQRSNAKVRGIRWELTLWQWWTIWQASGCWEKRGRGKGFVMCRPGDTGPYALGNIYIATAGHNSAVQPNNPYRLGHPDHEMVVRRLREAA